MNPPPASTEGIHRHNCSVKIQEAKIAKVVKFTTEELQRIMNKKHNIRNVSVIGQLDHGKSKLIDSVVAAVRIIGEEVDTDISVMDTCANKTEHCITVKSTGISLYYKMTDQSLRTFKGERDGNEYLINLIDTPGHVDFSSEVTAALRITDGALVLIDCVEGVCVQTETVLCQAHAEMVRPVLALNKIDRCFMDLNLDGEEMYQQLSWIINNANEHMTKYGDDVKFCPVKGTVAFSAGVHGWAFTLTNFAKIFAPTFDFDEYKMAEKLWGENFYDASTKEWSTENTGSATCIRGFVMFCYQPIKHVITLCMAGKKDEVCSYLESINVTIKNDEELMGKALEKYVLQTWLPASTALLQMMIFDLPSPSTAQKYRVSNLYKGPLEDKYATAISNCDPEGPLILYVSKMIPASVKGRFFALGRVFSGRVTTGMKVRIMGPNYVPGLKKDVYVQTVQHAVIWTPNKHELVNDAPAGNIVAVVGLDQFITKNATLTNGEEFDAYPFRAMKFSVSPILLVAVQCKVASDFPKLVEGLRCLVKSDPIVRCTIEESGEHVIAGTGELHLKVCLKDLQGYFMDGVEITSSTPAVSFRETVLEKSCRVMIESPNKHNCLHMQAYPLATELTKAIDEGYIKPGDEHEAYTKMVHEFDLNVDLTRKVWCFGPDMNGPNMVFDMCKGVPYLNDIKDSIVAGFQWASKEGSLAEESMRGIGFGICGAVLHADAINRVNGQVIPMVKRAIYASQLRAKPRLVEPVYLVEIQAPEHSLGIIYGVLRQVRGEVFDVIQRTGTPLYNIRAYLPVIESFGFSSTLEVVTSGQAFPQCMFDHWDILPSDPLEVSSQAAQLVLDVRKRKGLKEQIPSIDGFCSAL